MIEDLYQEVILDHFKNPRGRGELPEADSSMVVYNPLCGDKVGVAVRAADDGVVQEVKFSGQGCSISQASASIMSELCTGKSLVEIRALHDDFLALIKGNKLASDLPNLSDALALEGVKRFPARVRCAVLAWEAIGKCVDELIERQQGEAESLP